MRKYFGDPTDVSEKQPPARPSPEEEREIEYLVCRQCDTPCYVFQMDAGRLIEAFCAVCGNDDVHLFRLTEEEEDE
jgi:hypothetical protein